MPRLLVLDGTSLLPQALRADRANLAMWGVPQLATSFHSEMTGFFEMCNQIGIQVRNFDVTAPTFGAAIYRGIVPWVPTSEPRVPPTVPRETRHETRVNVS